MIKLQNSLFFWLATGLCLLVLQGYGGANEVDSSKEAAACYSQLGISVAYQGCRVDGAFGMDETR
ncbi:MAG: hypothetical protein AAFO83_15395 [Cyanobacteria bacterium J06607_13]